MIYLIKRYYKWVDNTYDLEYRFTKILMMLAILFIIAATVIAIWGYIILFDAMIHEPAKPPKPSLQEQIDDLSENDREHVEEYVGYINKLSSKDKKAVEEYAQFLYFRDSIRSGDV